MYWSIMIMIHIILFFFFAGIYMQSRGEDLVIYLLVVFFFLDITDIVIYKV